VAYIPINKSRGFTPLVVKKAKALEYMPERCSWLTGNGIPKQKYRKLIFEKNYMLVFQVIGNNVYIDAMVDCRQDYRWLL